MVYVTRQYLWRESEMWCLEILQILVNVARPLIGIDMSMAALSARLSIGVRYWSESLWMRQYSKPCGARGKRRTCFGPLFLSARDKLYQLDLIA